MEDVTRGPERLIGGFHKPLRLVHCTPFAAEVGGGVGRMDWYYYRLLDRSLFDPVFVVYGKEKDGIVQYDPPIPYQFTGEDDRFARLVNLFRDADIVSYNSSMSPLVCHAARLSKVPALVEVDHCIEPGIMYSWIDAAVCVSEAVRLAQPDVSRTRVILNCVDPKEFPFRSAPRGDGKLVILEVTRKTKQSHFHLDELAGDLLPLDENIEIQIAGHGMEGDSGERVKYLGQRKDIADVYGQADLFVMLSKREPFGLVALEAMACGCLPIVADDGGMKEFVEHGVTGWVVNAGDRNAVIATVRDALAVRGGGDGWEKMRHAARKKVEKEFAPEKMMRDYESLYLSLIEKKGRRHEPGPIYAPQPAEAHIDDALYYYHLELWDRMTTSIQKALMCYDSITTPLCAWIMDKMAKDAILRNNTALADGIYRKLFDSGFRVPDWMKTWRQYTDPLTRRLLGKELVKISPTDQESWLLHVEDLLAEGSLAEALKTLETGTAALPHSAELREIYALLKARLNTV